MFVAVDYGKYYYVSYNGELGTNRFREPGVNPGKTRLCEDFVNLVKIHFQDGYDVVTEASTIGSFGVRGRQDELLDLIDKYGCKIYTIGTKSCYNATKKLGLIGKGKRYENRTEFNKAHPFAASLIWDIFNKNGGKLWIPTKETEKVQRFDPVRPNYLTLVSLRSDDYPEEMMKFIYQYLPDFDELTDEQKQLMSGGQTDNHDYTNDQAAALICSLSEPLSTTRKGWERVIGSSRDGRPNIYRQMLVVGKGRNNYVPGYHFCGLSMKDATRTRRNLRSIILNNHPNLPGTKIL